ncbi:MAG: Uncharacterised protein [Flavobacteriia bacterium]|nr:MAG: Uncharacterised protein [Flavobacteriia bacterium]
MTSQSTPSREMRYGLYPSTVEAFRNLMIIPVIKVGKDKASASQF